MKRIALSILFAILAISQIQANNGIITFSEDAIRDNLGKNEFRCRKPVGIGKDYGVQVTGYDIPRGITFCQIYSLDETNANKTPYSVNANLENKKAAEEYNYSAGIKDAVKKGLKAFGIDANFGIDTSIDTEVKVEKGQTLTAFLVDLATLNNANPNNSANLSVKQTDAATGETILDKSLDSVSKAFNQANLKYFEKLFYGLNEVYVHLQNLLFVVVGGFFLATLGGQKLQKYLENRGQSTGNKEPYLHKFFIPLLCAGVFYMPISSGGGVNSTMIQKIIQYFAIQANHIADVASAKASAIYINKIIENTAISAETFELVDNEHILKKDKARQERIRDIAKQELQNKCYPRWGEDYINSNPKLKKLDEKALIASFDKGVTKTLEKEIKDYVEREEKDENQCRNGGGKYGYCDITLDACKDLNYVKQNAEKNLEKIKTSFENLDKMSGRQKDFASHITQFKKHHEKMTKLNGWINSIIVSSSGLFLETLPLYQQVTYKAQSSLNDTIERQRDALHRETKTESEDAELSTMVASQLMGGIVYLILPGANNVRKIIVESGKDANGNITSPALRLGLRSAACTIIMNNAFYGTDVFFGENTEKHTLTEKAVALIETAICTGTIFSDSVKVIADRYIPGLLSNFLDLNTENELITFYIGLRATIILYQYILENLPILITMIAGVLAFIGYFITLCKYFYISPFVVAFALTTKRIDKIVNFLVTGITIFFKPILIVIFIHLSLFFIVIIKELFIALSLMQFGAINDDIASAGAFITISVIKSMIMLLGSLASIYVVWKTIMSGPDWTFKLLGLDKDTDNVISQGLAQKLETKAIVV